MARDKRRTRPHPGIRVHVYAAQCARLRPLPDISTHVQRRHGREAPRPSSLKRPRTRRHWQASGQLAEQECATTQRRDAAYSFTTTVSACHARCGIASTIGRVLSLVLGVSMCHCLVGYYSRRSKNIGRLCFVLPLSWHPFLRLYTYTFIHFPSALHPCPPSGGRRFYVLYCPLCRPTACKL